MTAKLLLGVGAMKAGTTFLYEILSRHRELYFTPEKEVHFFAHEHGLDVASMRPIIDAAPLLKRSGTAPRIENILSDDFRRDRLAAVMRGRFAGIKDPQQVRDIVLWYADRYLRNPIGWQWFDRLYDNAKPEQWLCELSNYNSFLTPETWGVIKERFDDIKVIYVVREPLDRLWSHIKFDRRYEAHEFEAGQSVTAQTISLYLSDPHICAHGDYERVIENLHRHIGPENTLTLSFEDLISGAEHVCEKIARYLNIESFDHSVFQDQKPSNAGLKMQVPPELVEMTQKFVDRQNTFLKNLPDF